MSIIYKLIKLAMVMLILWTDDKSYWKDGMMFSSYKFFCLFLTEPFDVLLEHMKNVCRTRHRRKRTDVLPLFDFPILVQRRVR